MRVHIGILNVLTLFIIVPAASGAQAAAPIHVWEKVEITLTAAGAYANPYTDVEVWVDLKGPNFKKRCYGFWDGGQTFRVRIAPVEPGTWTWVSGSNPPDPGLAGKKGSFESVAWTETERQENPVRRGFFRATPNGHALQYADGTPYFIIGDFFYPASTWRYRWRDSDETYPVESPEAGFKDLLKFRKKQDFNMIYIISSFGCWAYDGLPNGLKDQAGVPLRSGWPSASEDRIENMPNEDGERPFFFPGKAVGYPNVCPDYMRLNPSYFRYLDKKIDYANAQGFQVFIETLRRDVGPYLRAYYGATDPDLSKNSVFQYIRYIFARYQANAVSFGIVHQDLGQVAFGLGPQDWLVAIEGYYKKYGPPPFGQLVTTNINGSTYRVWGHTDKAPWLTMHLVGNIPRDHRSSEQLIEIFYLPNPLPAYNQEPWFVSNDTPDERRRNRSTMYSCLLNGGLAGIAHQAKGLTRGNRERLDKLSTAEPPKLKNARGELYDADSHPNMWISIKWSTADELRYTRDFITTPAGRYQDLAPHRELLSVFKTGNVLQEGWSYCMRTDDKTIFKLYFEKNAARPSLSGALPKTVYRAQWFDPRTGGWSNVGNGTLSSDAEGRIELPACPTVEDDWAMSLSK